MPVKNGKQLQNRAKFIIVSGDEETFAFSPHCVTLREE
jgi:hypothetical protein